MSGKEGQSTAQKAVDQFVRKTGRLRVQGAEIHYEVYGQGPTIVFAHGLGGSHMSWWQQVAHFGQSFTCVTFAHRGFAPSTVDLGQPDPANFADDLSALLDHLQIDRAHLVGQSMGGWTVLEFCLRHPERTRSLVMSATTGSINFELIPNLDHAALAAWTQAVSDSAAQRRSAKVHNAAGPRLAMEQPAMHLLYVYIDEFSRHLDKEALRNRLRAMRVRSPNELVATGVPVMLISPDEDIVIPPVAQRSLARAVDGARLIKLPRTGHSPYFENAPEFNRHLEDFLRGVESASLNR